MDDNHNRTEHKNARKQAWEAAARIRSSSSSGSLSSSSSNDGNGNNVQEVRGDPRMNRAVEAKLKDPSISLDDAIAFGGFHYPHRSTATVVDDENVRLGQRKNQLNRRLRRAKQNTTYSTTRAEASSKPAIIRISPGRKRPAVPEHEDQSQSNGNNGVVVVVSMKDQEDKCKHEEDTLGLYNANFYPIQKHPFPVHQGSSTLQKRLQEDCRIPTGDSSEQMHTHMHMHTETDASYRREQYISHHEWNSSGHLALAPPPHIQNGANHVHHGVGNGGNSNSNTESDDHHYNPSSTGVSYHHGHQHQHHYITLNESYRSSTSTSPQQQLFQQQQQQQQQQHPPREAAAAARVNLGLLMFETELHSIYRQSMLQAGFAPEETQETSTEYRQFALLAWQNECERLQDLMQRDGGRTITMASSQHESQKGGGSNNWNIIMGSAVSSIEDGDKNEL